MFQFIFNDKMELMRAITAVKGELSSKTKTKFSQWLQKNYITQVRVQDFVRGGGGGEQLRRPKVANVVK